MQVQVSKGLATWAGIVGALGQYAAAVAVFLDDPDKATAAAPLGTATVTLIVLIVGRMSQAKAQIEAGAQPSVAAQVQQRAVAAGVLPVDFSNNTFEPTQLAASNLSAGYGAGTNVVAPVPMSARRIASQEIPEFDPKLEVPGGSVRVPSHAKAVAK